MWVLVTNSPVQLCKVSEFYKACKIAQAVTSGGISAHRRPNLLMEIRRQRIFPKFLIVPFKRACKDLLMGWKACHILTKCNPQIFVECLTLICGEPFTRCERRAHVC
jgi:hypothetical protein